MMSCRGRCSGRRIRHRRRWCQRWCEFGQQVPDLGEIFGGAALVHHIGQELAELVDLEQAERLAYQRGDQPGAGGERLPPR